MMLLLSLYKKRDAGGILTKKKNRKMSRLFPTRFKCLSFRVQVKTASVNLAERRRD